MRSVLTLILLTLAACQDPAPADTAVSTPPDDTTSVETTGAGDTIPTPFLGSWDEDAAACAESSSMSRFNVSPTEIYWFGGTGDVTGVRGDGDRIEVDLSYVTEGSPTSEPEPTVTALSLDDAGRLSLGLGGGREGLVRCGEAIDRNGLEPAAPGEDQTVAFRFAPGATSATVSDTLRAFVLHDYLVRASAGQRLTATLRADGPGVPVVIVIREDTYRGPEGDFETVAPDEQGTTGDGYGWAGVLPAAGTYRVRVAHSGPAANGGAVNQYTLTVGTD